MSKLPDKFPEYLIMYKTLSKQIQGLVERKDSAQKSETIEIELKIQNYQTELKGFAVLADIPRNVLPS